MKPALLLILANFGVALVPAFGQGAVEREAGRRTTYPAVWPQEPPCTALPAWAAPGRIRFSRWDGGRIETAKAFLSGWPGFNPPNPDYLYTMTNWYQPRTVRLAKEAGLNLIWVSLSVGFSDDTESEHRVEIKKYIDECHRQGIHVMAYESIANMFWEDLFAKVPESQSWIQLGKDGKPVPYGAATFAKMGRITRYMADLSNPSWRAQLMKRIDFAIESGADGLVYDNNFGESLFDLYQQLVHHALSRKGDFLIMANFHSRTYVLNRLLNCITTEDAVEPGLYSTSSVGYAGLGAYQLYELPVGGKRLMNNLGLMRVHETLAEGWKPVMIEAGRREHEERMVGFMSPERTQLAMAEAMTFGVAYEQYVEGRPAHQLISGSPSAVETWKAIGKYNRFFGENEQLYVGARSSAPLVCILDDASDGVPMLDGLAARGVLFDVLYERDLRSESLSKFKAVALLNAPTVRTSALSALEQFVRRGGKLIAARDAGTIDETGSVRPQPPFFRASGSTTYFERLPAIDRLAETLRLVSGEPPLRINAPPGVLANITIQPSRSRTLVHLLNYTLTPATDLHVGVKGRYARASLLSPDGETSFGMPPQFDRHAVTFIVPRLKIYSIVVLDSK